MKQFTKRGFVVTAVHIGVVTVMLVSTEVSRLFMRERPVAPIDFTVAIPDLGQTQQYEEQVERSEPTPVKPEPVAPPEPVAEPKKTEPKKDPPKETAMTVVEEKPASTWKPVSANEIKIGPKVKGPNLPPPTVKTSDKTLAEIEELLKKGAKPGTTTSIPEGDDLFKAKIQNACYRAWAQPTTSAANGKKVQTEIRFSLSGQYLGGKILKRSGIAELDDSVEAALQSIGNVSGIPREFFEYYNGRFPVTFEVED